MEKNSSAVNATPASFNDCKNRKSSLRRFFFPGTFGCLGDEAFFKRAGRDAYVADFAAGQNRLHTLQVHMELALGDRRDVRADAAAFLRFTTAPDDAAFHRAFAGQFTDSCHKILSLKSREE